jgi:hypothetical protein
MLREFRPDLAVAFPGASGTADCVRQALRLGVTVRRVDPVLRRLLLVMR